MKILGLLVAFVLAALEAAAAATSSGRLDVTATVRANCVLRAPAGASAPTLTIQCTKGSPGVRVAFGASSARRPVEYVAQTGQPSSIPMGEAVSSIVRVESQPSYDHAYVASIDF